MALIFFDSLTFLDASRMNLSRLAAFVASLGRFLGVLARSEPDFRQFQSAAPAVRPPNLGYGASEYSYSEVVISSYGVIP